MFSLQGNPTYEGHIKVTQTTLELFKRGSPPISWPLKSIRRYGKDADARCFTFESGRRCPTGPGVYVFRCSRTQQLFERVQCYVRQSTESEAARRSSFGRIIEAEPPVSPRDGAATAEPPVPNSASTQSQLGNGSGQQNNQYVNVTVDPQRPKPPPLPSTTTSSNFTAETLPSASFTAAAAQYENVNVGAATLSPLSQQPPQMIAAASENAFDDDIEAKEATNFQINYATLELSPVEANNNQNSDSEGHEGSHGVHKDEGVASEGPEGAAVRPRDYALIDFDRTQALSQAVRPLQRDGRGGECAQESGIRKTRHNSTLESICTLQT